MDQEDLAEWLIMQGCRLQGTNQTGTMCFEWRTETLHIVPSSGTGYTDLEMEMIGRYLRGISDHELLLPDFPEPDSPSVQTGRRQT